MKRLALSGRDLAVLSEEMKVTAKLCGPVSGLRQDITLAESVALLGGGNDMWNNMVGGIQTNSLMKVTCCSCSDP